MVETSARRKLTTILAADVVGYSQMMATDEEATLRTLRTFRSVTDGLVEKHGGRVFSTAGDAFLAEFGSAVEAVRCAISIQEDLAVRNLEHRDAQQIWFRIGINVGDVMIEGEDLFGDGVNVAARLEGLAEKGGICISGSTFDQVKSKLSIAFEEIGAQRVKNIPEPIPTFRIVPGNVALTGAAGSAAGGPPSGAKPASTAMLAAAGAAVGLLVLLAVLAAQYFGLNPLGQMAAHPFDGRWKTTVDALTGCLDNSPRSFALTVRDGRISEPQQPLPKSGEVLPDGNVSITVTDPAGSPRATIVAQIIGGVGQGRFHGKKPACTGAVKMVRLE
jgi:class 3 adenylate cyclase